MNDLKGLSVEDKRRLAKRLLDVDGARGAVDEPIAVVGAACRYPGGVTDPDGLWRLLEASADAIGEVPRDRWDAAALYDPDPEARGRSTTRRGGFVDGVDRFDASFFGLSPREAVHLDPQQRLLLECAWEAVERAGEAPPALAGSATGVFVGLMSQDYGALHGPSLHALDGHVLTGNGPSLASGRLSYVLGLRGPSLTVDTACSSSLVALHLACQSLRLGECERALAGGVTLVLTPALHVEFSRLRGLSPDGRCKSFGAGADGVGWSEGCGLVVLKRLADARRAGDPILGVLRGSAVNQDGRSNGLTAPSGGAQEAVLRAALRRAGVRAGEVGYVEAHGTGTRLGDPIEAAALAAVYARERPSERPLRIGSVKSNLGHTQAAAGVAGLIKVLLAMRHQALPASLHAGALSPHVPWDAHAMRVVREREPWPRSDRPRLAGVSAFGISGTNAHLIVEEAPALEDAPRAPAPGPYLVPLSGREPAALHAQAERLAAHLEAHPSVALADVAHTLARRRAHFPSRAALVASSAERLVGELRALAAAPSQEALRAPTAFLFTGQGSQFAGMGRGLYEVEPAFRRALDACAEALRGHLDHPLLQVMFDGDARLRETQYTQPAVFALGWSLHALWRAFGVRPDLVMGHSVGEYVAACAAGVFAPDDAIRLVAARGRLMAEVCATGAMLAVEAPEALVAGHVAAYPGRLSIAAVNGPWQTVLAGDEPAVREAEVELRAGGVAVRRLAVSHGFHSPLMRPMLERFRAAVEGVARRAPTLPLVSNVTGALAGDEVATADYWVRHVEMPVRFADGARSLLAAGARTFVELGPQPTLLAMAAGCLDGEEGVSWLPSLRRGHDDVGVVLHSLGALWSRGAEVDWAEVERAREGRRVELPTYPFQRRRYWIEPAAASHAGEPAGHPLLGARVPLASGETVFETSLGGAALPWLTEHRVGDAVVVPGAALVEWARAAAEAREGGAWRVEELLLERALTVPDAGVLRTQATVSRSEDGALRFALFSRGAPDDAPWVRHATGRLTPDGALAPEVRPPVEGATGLSLSTLYADFEAAGLRYGPAFRAVRAAWSMADGAVVAKLSSSPPASEEARAYGLHPALLDAALHAAGLLETPSAGRLFLPLAFHDATIGASGAPGAWARVAIVARSPAALTTSVTVWDEHDEVIARIGALECKRVDPEDLSRARSEGEELLYELEWQPLEPTGPTASAATLTLASPGAPSASVDALAAGLRAGGARVECASLDALAGGAAGDTVVYLDAPDEGGAPFERAEARVERGLRLARALAARRGGRLLWVIPAAQRAGDGDVVAPDAAAAWGLARVWLREMPHWRTTLVDHDGPAEDLAAALHAELPARDGEAQVAWRGGIRHVARVARARPGDAGPASSEGRGAVVVTGGLGALGLAIARHLASAHSVRHLVLLGRGGPGAEAGATLEALRAEGVRVDVRAVDVSDREALAAVLGELDVPLRGAVHAAGFAEAALLPQQGAEHVARAFTAKARGAWNLHALTRAQALEFFVMVSSVAALAPEAGQGSYAAANAFLDGLAHARRAEGLCATSVGFGPWSGAGQLERLAPSERARMHREGMRLLPPAAALAGLDAALRHGGAQLAVLSLDLDGLRRAHEGSALPSHWRQLVRVGVGPRPPERDRWRARLAEAPVEARGATLEALVRGEVARVLALPSADSVPRERALTELGLDSLTALDLRRSLGAALGVELPAAVAWDHPTPAALAAHLLDALARKADPAPPATRRPPRALRLHPEPPFSPIFGVGGGLGGATYLKDLALELGPLHPFLTLPYPGLEDDGEPIARLDALAEHFKRALRAEHPRGPYVLLGHSFGGLVAYEMARQLAREGEAVLDLILLDAWMQETVDDKRYTFELPDLDTLLGPFQRAGKLPPDAAAHADRFARIWRANGQALAGYDMGRYDGDVTLVVPEEDLFGLSGNVAAWGAVCEHLKVRRTGGDHATMVLPPHAKRTAHILRGILRDGREP